MQLAPRITAEAGKCGGRPCVRGLRIRVADVLELLASGMTRKQILRDYPSLEYEDFDAVLKFAAIQADRPLTA